MVFNITIPGQSGRGFFCFKNDSKILFFNELFRLILTYCPVPKVKEKECRYSEQVPVNQFSPSQVPPQILHCDSNLIVDMSTSEQS